MVSFMTFPQVYRYVEDPVSARGLGDVVSVRYCSGGITTTDTDCIWHPLSLL